MASEKITMREALEQIRHLALEANEEYEDSCRRKVGRIHSLANQALGGGIRAF